jgi:hypothetical protein
LNQIASELAFHRRRVARGFYDNNEVAVQREITYINQLLDLRRTIEQGGR